jgi:sugar phosphate permease
MLVILLGTSYFLMSKIVFTLSFIFIFLQQFVRGFSEPVFSDYINKLTTSDVRATILSVKSMLGNLIYAIIIPFIGWIADVYSILQALTIAGITTVVAGTIILVILHKDKVI